MKHQVLLMVLLLGLNTLAGCQTRKPMRGPSGQVGLEMIVPTGVLRHEMREDQLFLAPEFVSEPQLPEYPAHLLLQDLPEQAVCLEIDIDAGGEVCATRELTDITGCTAAHGRPDRAFHDAAVAAAVRWRFLAAAICTFPAGAEKNDACQGQRVTMDPVEVRLAFVFRFRAEPGGARVLLREL